MSRLTVCQETREIEMRTGQKWYLCRAMLQHPHPLETPAFCIWSVDLAVFAGLAWSDHNRHPIWGFRVKTPLHSSIFWSGKDPLMPEILFGENRLTGERFGSQLRGDVS
jgi:hypothetical protein